MSDERIREDRREWEENHPGELAGFPEGWHYGVLFAVGIIAHYEIMSWDRKRKLIQEIWKKEGTVK